MRVAQRLIFSVLPAVAGVLLAAVFVYWGGAGWGVSRFIVPVALAAAAFSLVAAWWNGRFIGSRIERLGRAVAAQRSRGVAAAPDAPHGAARREEAPGVARGAPDELDDIEAQLYGLGNAVAAARDDATRRELAAGARASEYAALIDDLTRLMAARLQDAQLPLHILLSSPFGTLNENQEEMLGAAKAAVDTADGELQRLRKLLEVDRGVLAAVPRAIGIAELLRPVLAIGAARASASQVQLRTKIANGAPRVIADAMLAQEALTTILGRAIAAAPSASDVTLEAHETDGGCVAIAISQPAPCQGDTLDIRLARRLLAAQGAGLDEAIDRTVITLPAEGLVRVRS